MSKQTGRPQTGVVLVTSLIMLVIMTLLVVSLVRSNVIELKIGGANQVAAQNLANAEAAVWAFMNAPNNRNRFYPGAPLIVNLSTEYNFSSATFAHLSNVTLAVTEISCTLYAGVGTGTGLDPKKAPTVVYFDLRLDSRDPLFFGRTVVHQGVRALLSPLSCP